MRDEERELDEVEDAVTGLLGAVFARRLRLRHGLERAAGRVGLSARTLQRLEKGESTPRPDTLALLAEKNGFTRHQVERLQSQLEAHGLAAAGGLAGGAATPRRSFAAEIAAAALEAVETAAAAVAVEPAPAPWEETGKPRPEDRRRADTLWQRFTRKDRGAAYRLVRESSAYRIWSFAERLSHESEAAAADSPAEALELARLAVEIARGVRGTASWRARVAAFALPHFGNAHRVCNDLDQARAAFVEARKLQEAFSASDPKLLDESRLPDLEASLCREERRFSEALALLAEALALAPPQAKGRVLLKRAATLEQMGAYQSALETLQEAEPHVLGTGTERDLLVLRFDTAVCLVHLEQTGRAEELLPEIQELAERLGKALDRLRTHWLAARIAAGLGRAKEAVAVLDRVCTEFLGSKPPLPYDAALVGLDLALYWLKQGDTAAVRKLAPLLERVFTAQGIRREALGALRLFCQAARRDAATLELAEKAKTELERRPRR
jgi:tetratricopeptide (TPR) repeat protein